MKKGHREVPFFILQPDYLAAEAAFLALTTFFSTFFSAFFSTFFSAAGAEAAGFLASAAKPAEAATAKARPAATRVSFFMVKSFAKSRVYTLSSTSGAMLGSCLLLVCYELFIVVSLCCAGQPRVKRAPPRGLSSMRTWPWCASMICRTMAKPSP